MERLNPKQVEWLVVNQPETRHKAIPFGDWYNSFTTDDLKYVENGSFKYYLTPETYNALQTEFKQLAD